MILTVHEGHKTVIGGKTNRGARFGLVVAATYILAGGALALGSSHGQSYLQDRGVVVANLADRGVLPAKAGYQAAYKLNSSNIRIAGRLAKLQIGEGDTKAAVATLSKAQLDGDSQIVLSGAYLEAGDPEAALQTLTSRNEGVALQRAVVLAATRWPVDEDTRGQIISAEGKRHLASALEGGVPLSTELLSRQLYHSAQKVLQDTPDNSITKYLILAEIAAARPGQKESRWQEAERYLKKGLAIDPANLKLHQELANLYKDMGNTKAADAEQDLAQRLQSGRL